MLLVSFSLRQTAVKMLSGVVWTCVLFLQGVFCAGSDVVSVSVKEGDSVTLHNDFKITENCEIKWYFNDTRIAEIDFYDDKTCTDVQCNEGTERFRDRLKLDHQTGNLTIMNIANTDSGDYTLVVIYTHDDHERTFIVTVNNVSAAANKEMKTNSEGESDTSDPGLSTGARAGVCAAVLLLVISAAVLFVIYRRQARRKGQTKERTRVNEKQVTLVVLPQNEFDGTAEALAAADENP